MVLKVLKYQFGEHWYGIQQYNLLCFEFPSGPLYVKDEAGFYLHVSGGPRQYILSVKEQLC